MAKKTTKKVVIVFVILLFILATGGVVVLYLFPADQTPTQIVDTVEQQDEQKDSNGEATANIKVEEESNTTTKGEIRTSLTIVEEE